MFENPYIFIVNKMTVIKKYEEYVTWMLLVGYDAETTRIILISYLHYPSIDPINQCDYRYPENKWNNNSIRYTRRSSQLILCIARLFYKSLSNGQLIRELEIFWKLIFNGIMVHGKILLSPYFWITLAGCKIYAA